MLLMVEKEANRYREVKIRYFVCQTICQNLFLLMIEKEAYMKREVKFWNFVCQIMCQNLIDTYDQESDIKWIEK